MKSQKRTYQMCKKQNNIIGENETERINQSINEHIILFKEEIVELLRALIRSDHFLCCSFMIVLIAK